MTPSIRGPLGRAFLKEQKDCARICNNWRHHRLFSWAFLPGYTSSLHTSYKLLKMRSILVSLSTKRRYSNQYSTMLAHNSSPIKLCQENLARMAKQRDTSCLGACIWAIGITWTLRKISSARFFLHIKGKMLVTAKPNSLRRVNSSIPSQCH